MCIQSTANRQLTISFDFHDEKKEGQILSVRKLLNTKIIFLHYLKNWKKTNKQTLNYLFEHLQA